MQQSSVMSGLVIEYDYESKGKRLIFYDRISEFAQFPTGRVYNSHKIQLLRELHMFVQFHFLVALVLPVQANYVNNG
jgi:hypothetical protein